MATIDLTTHQAIENGVRLTRGARRMIRELVGIREERGLRPADVAEAIGIHRSGVTRFENQETPPRLDTILRYAHTVGASVTFTVEPCEVLEARLGGPRRAVVRDVWSESLEDERDSSVRPDTVWRSATGGQGRRIALTQ